MDVASLLQGAPSTDRTRRQKQLQTPQQTHRVGPEEETRGLKADIGATAGAGSFQVVHEYVHPSVQQSRNSANYYPPQPVPQRLPIQPPPDYVDVNTESGLIRMKKEHYSQHNIHGFIAQPRPSHDHQQWPTSAEPIDQQAPVNSPQHRIKRRLSPVRLPAVDLPAAPPTPLPRLDPVDIGTFVYPILPFPIRPSTLPVNRRTTTTILVPASFIPQSTAAIAHDSRRSKLWGGIPHTDQRKIYTDDSDLVFAALHSGIVNSSEKPAGRDLELKLRLYFASDSGRYIGGPGAAGLTSASWGNSHEGCAFTILSANWIAPKSARSHSRQTRKARMSEYASRRAAVMGIVPNPSPVDSDHPILDKLSHILESLPITLEGAPFEKELSSLSITGSWTDAAGFKYEPSLLHTMLFGHLSNKRRKLDPYPTASQPLWLVSSAPSDFVLSGSNGKRFILVPKPSKLPSQEPSVEEKRQGQVYDVYQEKVLPFQENNEVKLTEKGKGVRFADGVHLLSADKTNSGWERTLVFENAQEANIRFTEDGLQIVPNRSDEDMETSDALVDIPVRLWWWRTKRSRHRSKSKKASARKLQKKSESKGVVETAVVDPVPLELPTESVSQEQVLPQEDIEMAAPSPLPLAPSEFVSANIPPPTLPVSPHPIANIVETAPPVTSTVLLPSEEREEGEISSSD